ncbi:uncharacterized protein [Palaemon carinicauda]|uniref:uncharacterized protein n=1 Tax=Palaemon carinicauda TaxID=392227 RepID=UPI0035B59F6C
MPWFTRPPLLALLIAVEVFLLPTRELGGASPLPSPAEDPPCRESTVAAASLDLSADRSRSLTPARPTATPSPFVAADAQWVPSHPVIQRAPVPSGQKGLSHNVSKSLKCQVLLVRPCSPAYSRAAMRKPSPVPAVAECHPVPETTRQRSPMAESACQRSPARHQSPTCQRSPTRKRAPACQRSPVRQRSPPRQCTSARPDPDMRRISSSPANFPCALAHNYTPSLFGSGRRKEASSFFSPAFTSAPSELALSSTLAYAPLRSVTFAPTGSSSYRAHFQRWTGYDAPTHPRAVSFTRF